jgi:phosphate transport system permease protein
VTSASLLASIRAGRDRAGVARVDSVEIDPKEDGLLAIGSSWMRRWKLDLRHPEAAIASLFTRVWYEGYPRPEHVWQSTGGTADFEPKLGLVPLVFGTLKATLLLDAVRGAARAPRGDLHEPVPLSELRSPIKSTVEMMASLPSVVLGFLAAIVVAPSRRGSSRRRSPRS